ncbi:hypothetical protein AtNW77_Chr4g0285251 [Arabidopsis thaliana]
MSMVVNSSDQAITMESLGISGKRPTRLDIPIGVDGFVAPISSSADVTVTSREECREVEREGDDYSVYCKRGRREAREVVSSWAPMIMLDERTKKC